MHLDLTPYFVFSLFCQDETGYLSTSRFQNRHKMKHFDNQFRFFFDNTNKDHKIINHVRLLKYLNLDYTPNFVLSEYFVFSKFCAVKFENTTRQKLDLNASRFKTNICLP